MDEFENNLGPSFTPEDEGEDETGEDEISEDEAVDSPDPEDDTLGEGVDEADEYEEADAAEEEDDDDWEEEEEDDVEEVGDED